MAPGVHASASRPLLAATVILQIALALVLAGIYQSGRNSLRNNGNWVSTKAELDRGVMGAVSFLYGLQPLAGAHLDLSAWHGYHEVVSKEWFDPAAVELRFLVRPGGHLSVLLRRDDGEVLGIRISQSRLYPSMFFRATAEGEFTFKQEIPRLRNFSQPDWHTLRLELGERRLRIFGDGEQVRNLELAVDPPLQVGFRGGRGKALVDDVRIVERDGRLFRESFNQPGNWLAVNLASLAGVLAVSAALFVVLRRITGLTVAGLAAYFLMITGALVIISLMLLAFGTYTKRFYPDQSAKLLERERYRKESTEKALIRRIESRYGQPPAPGTRRVLFLGSSQTHGAGAATAEQTLVRQTERLLNELPGDERFECVNVAVNGYRLEEMVRAYLDRWIDLQPSIVVLNASNNDIGHGQGQFRRWLTTLAERNRELGIDLVLVMEPNAPERRSSLRQMHGIMRAVGEQYGLVVVDMHGHLLARHDDGFLWWDWVHLTSFGQRLFAERLATELS